MLSKIKSFIKIAQASRPVGEREIFCIFSLFQRLRPLSHCAPPNRFQPFHLYKQCWFQLHCYHCERCQLLQHNHGPCISYVNVVTHCWCLSTFREISVYFFLLLHGFLNTLKSIYYTLDVRLSLLTNIWMGANKLFTVNRVSDVSVAGLGWY